MKLKWNEEKTTALDTYHNIMTRRLNMKIHIYFIMQQNKTWRNEINYTYQQQNISEECCQMYLSMIILLDSIRFSKQKKKKHINLW